MRWTRRVWRAGTLAGALLVSLDAARADDPELARDLAAVGRLTVLFGHQSVGNNILDGLRELAASEKVRLPIAELDGAPGPRAGLVHVLVAENGKPELKLQSFERALAAAGPGVDVAMLKFCYVDVTEGTDPKALFGAYAKAARELKARYPGTTFVHVTAPLTTIPAGPKAFVKRLLGRDRNRQENAKREEYNALLRQEYQGREPIYDLARLESERPDGQVETYGWRGRRIPALTPAYTDDGGHLAGEGRRRAARNLLALLVSLPPPAAPGEAGAR
jgi:hypothetical protein